MNRIPRIRRRAHRRAGAPGALRAVGEAASPPGSLPGRRGQHDRGHALRSGLALVPADRRHPVRDMRGRTGKLAAHGAGRRTAHRSQPGAQAEHNRDTGTCRVEIRLARGRLRPLLRMRLDIDRWTWSPARTALELIPCQRVRPTAAFFRAGHLLLDSLTHSLPQHILQAHAADLGTPSSLGPPPYSGCNWFRTSDPSLVRRGNAVAGRGPAPRRASPAGVPDSRYCPWHWLCHHARCPEKRVNPRWHMPRCGRMMICKGQPHACRRKASGGRGARCARTWTSPPTPTSISHAIAKESHEDQPVGCPGHRC